jgi:preprotein translocase subunit SecD
MLYFSRWQTFFIWLAVALGIAYAAPNVLPQSYFASLPSWAPSRPMTLGLDLQGGSHILLQLDRNQLVTERLNTARDDIRRVLRDARIGYTGLSTSGQFVQVRVRDEAQIDAARSAISELTQPVASGLFGAGTIRELDMAEPEPGLFRLTLTEEGISYRLSSALAQSIEVVSRRVNELVLADAESAAAEPDSDAMITAASTATIPSPPRMWPTQATAKSTMRRDNPPAFINSPARMKKGTAISGNESVDVIKPCAKKTGEIVPL